jgi:hypothetical protein
MVSAASGETASAVRNTPYATHGCRPVSVTIQPQITATNPIHQTCCAGHKYQRVVNKRPRHHSQAPIHPVAIMSVIIGTLAALAAAYLLLGPLRISAGRSGRKVPRFKAVERFAHWLTAGSFVVLGLTGLNITFGKHLLLPLIGYDAFSVVSEAAKRSCSVSC